MAAHSERSQMFRGIVMEASRSERIRCVENNLSESQIRKIIDALRRGELIVYPTETLYGLGANALDETAVKKVYMVKKRPFDMPLSIAVSDIEMLEEVAVVDERAEILIKRFMPGPLTILLTKKPVIPDILTSGIAEVGVRIPDNPLALTLIRKFGNPITSTSANLHSHQNPTNIDDVIRDLGDSIRFYIDCGTTTIGKPSTIVQFNEDGFEIIRKGAIPVEQIEAALNE